MTKAILRQALDALIWTTGSADFGVGGKAEIGSKKLLFPAISALQAAIDAPEPEPYAYAVYFPDQPTVELVHDLDALCDDMTNREHEITPLYAHPPAVRDPLTNGEIYTAYVTATNQTLRPQDERLALAFARAIESAHGIGVKP